MNEEQGQRLTDDMIRRAKELLPGRKVELREVMFRRAFEQRCTYGRGLAWHWYAPKGREVGWVGLYEYIDHETEDGWALCLEFGTHARSGANDDHRAKRGISAAERLFAQCSAQREMAEALELLERTLL